MMSSVITLFRNVMRIDVHMGRTVSLLQTNLLIGNGLDHSDGDGIDECCVCVSHASRVTDGQDVQMSKAKIKAQTGN